MPAITTPDYSNAHISCWDYRLNRTAEIITCFCDNEGSSDIDEPNREVTLDELREAMYADRRGMIDVQANGYNDQPDYCYQVHFLDSFIEMTGTEKHELLSSIINKREGRVSAMTLKGGIETIKNPFDFMGDIVRMFAPGLRKTA